MPACYYLDKISSGFYYVLAKTVPNFCILSMLLISFTVLVIPKSIDFVRKLCYCVIPAFAVVELVLISCFPLTNILDPLFVITTWVGTVVLGIIQVRKFKVNKSFLFYEQRIEHLKIIYQAIMYDIALLIISYQNYIPIWMGMPKAFYTTWEYYLIQDSYILVYTVIFCGSAFHPSWIEGLMEREHTSMMGDDDIEI